MWPGDSYAPLPLATTMSITVTRARKHKDEAVGKEK